MWKKTYSVTTTEVTKEQIWSLMADVNSWHTWDESIEFAKLQGKFESGNSFQLRPQGGPTVKVKLLEIEENRHFRDVTTFPMAKMYDDHFYEETEEGLRITSVITVKGFLGFLWVRLVAKDIVNNLPQDIDNQIAHAKNIEI